MELLTASTWWSTTLETYWRTAATSKFLGPKLDQAMAALETEECNSRDWLIQMPSTLMSFREGLRPGAFDDYESKCLNKVKTHVEVLSCCTSIKEARATGYFDFVEPLKEAAKIFSNAKEGAALDLEGKLQRWVSSMAGDYAINNFFDLLEASKGSAEMVDWGKFSSSLKTLSGSLPANSQEMFEKTKAVLPVMFAEFHEQALQSITFFFKTFFSGGPGDMLYLTFPSTCLLLPPSTSAHQAFPNCTLHLTTLTTEIVTFFLVPDTDTDSDTDYDYERLLTTDYCHLTPFHYTAYTTLLHKRNYTVHFPHRNCTCTVPHITICQFSLIQISSVPVTRYQFWQNWLNCWLIQYWYFSYLRFELLVTSH